MKYEDLYNDFEKLFPDDIDQLQKIAETAGAVVSDGMHVMFGMVVVPFIINLLSCDNTVKSRIAFDFFERMAEEDDVMISEVLEFTVLEDIISRGKDILGKCKHFMGEKTLKSCETIEKYLI